MEIKIQFYGGPLGGTSAFTNSLDQVKLFFADEARTVSCYRVLEEVTYVYDAKRSDALTSMYDKAKAEFLGRGIYPRVRFSDDPIPLPDDQFPNPAPSIPLKEKAQWEDTQKDGPDASSH